MNFVKMMLMMTVIDLAMDTGVDLTVTKIRELINEKFPDSDIDDGFIGTFLDQFPERLSMFTTMIVMQNSANIMSNYIEPFSDKIADGFNDLKVIHKLGKTVGDAFKTFKSGKINLGKMAKGVAGSTTTALAETKTNQLTEAYMRASTFLYYKQHLADQNAGVILNGVANSKIASNTKNLNKKSLSTEEMKQLMASLLEVKKYGG